MWKKDYTSLVHPLRGISPVSGAGDNTAQVSQIIDVADYDGLVFLVALGAIADADATFTMLVEHGNVANLSDAAAVPDDMLNGGTPLATGVPEVQAAFQFDSDDKTRKIGYHGDKRYVRLTITPANNTGAWLISVLAVLFGSRRQPTAVPPT